MVSIYTSKRLISLSKKSKVDLGKNASKTNLNSLKDNGVKYLQVVNSWYSLQKQEDENFILK